MSTALHAVTEATFATEVIEASRSRAVVVDFWAEWCGPCRQLTPTLAAVGADFAGQVDLVAVDVDANPNLSRQLGIQGIPAVKAFRDGRIVAELTGNQPEATLRSLFTQLAPSEAAQLTTAAAAASDDEATGLLERALEADPGHAPALVALARVRADAGDVEAARTLLGRAPQDADAQRLLAELALADADTGDADEVRVRAEAGDAEAQVVWGRILAARGDHGGAVDVLLRAVASPSARDDARAALVEVFAVLGDGHDLVRTARPKLAAALF